MKFAFTGHCGCGPTGPFAHDFAGEADPAETVETATASGRPHHSQGSGMTAVSVVSDSSVISAALLADFVRAHPHPMPEAWGNLRSELDVLL